MYSHPPLPYAHRQFGHRLIFLNVPHPFSAYLWQISLDHLLSSSQQPGLSTFQAGKDMEVWSHQGPNLGEVEALLE